MCSDWEYLFQIGKYVRVESIMGPTNWPPGLGPRPTLLFCLLLSEAKLVIQLLDVSGLWDVLCDEMMFNKNAPEVSQTTGDHPRPVMDYFPPM